MPPSRFCTTWIWLEGITRPVPVVTSSSGAWLAQVIAAAKAKMIVNSNTLADRRGALPGSRPQIGGKFGFLAANLRHWLAPHPADPTFSQRVEYGLSGAIGDGAQHDYALV